jgi:hypothetical protein
MIGTQFSVVIALHKEKWFDPGGWRTGEHCARVHRIVRERTWDSR